MVYVKSRYFSVNSPYIVHIYQELSLAHGWLAVLSLCKIGIGTWTPAHWNITQWYETFGQWKKHLVN